MPPTKREIGMRFNLDTTMARQQLAGLYTQLNSINKLGQNLGRNGNFGLSNEIMKAVSASTQLERVLGEAINPLTKNLDLTKFNNQLRISGMSLDSFKESFIGLGTEGAAVFNNLTKSIAMAETPLLQTSKAASEMWTVLGNTMRWQATSSLLHGVLSTASSAVNYVKSLDSSLNSIQIVTGQTAEQMSHFATQANEAAKQLNTTTNQYAKASLIYYQQGLSNKQVEERTATTIKLANVAGQSAKVVSDQLTAVWNNFYDGSKSLEYYADVMTALGASTASSTDEIAKGLSKFSSIAQTTGLSYEYATSALSTVVAATRQSADSVGTTFKTLFSRLQGLNLGETLDDGVTLNKYSKALNSIGVNILNANGSLKDMDNILDELGEKWQNLSDSQQVALAQTIGGVRSYTGLMSLMDNWGDFQKNLQTAQNAQGTLDAQAAIYAQSWEAASAHVRAASESIYSNLLDDKLIKGMTNGFGSILDVVGHVTDSLGGFGGTMMSLASIGTKFFEPQLTSAFNNIAYSIGGRDRAIELQERAIEDLMKPVSVSSYASVNKVQQNINKNLHDDLIAYRQGVANGKIDEYSQPAFQQLMNTVESAGQTAIQATQNSIVNTAEREYSSIISGTKYNSMIQKNSQVQNHVYTDLAKLAQERYDKLIEKGEDPTSIRVQQARQEVDSWNKFISDQTNGKLLRADEVASELAGINSSIAGLGSIKESFKVSGTEINGNELQAMANMAKTLVEGVGGDVDKLASNLGDRRVADAIMNVYKNTKDEKNIASKTQTEIKDLSDKITNANQDTMSSIIDKAIDSQGEKYADKVEAFTKQATKAFGGGTQGRREAEAFVKDLEKVASVGSTDKIKELIAKGDYEGARKHLKEELDAKNNAKATVSAGTALTNIASAAASIGTTLMSANRAIAVFRDETATTEQKISSVVTTMGTLPMTISSIANLTGSWGAKIGATGITVGGLATGIGVAAAGAVALGVAIDNYNKGTQKTALNNFTAAMSTAAQMASEAQQKYEQLPVIQQSYNNLLNSYSQTQAGTLEQTRSLLAVNEAANNIIEEYGLEYGKDYFYGAGNQIMISAQSFENAQKNAEEQAQNAAYNQTYMRAMQQLVSADYHSPTEELNAEVEEKLNKELENTYIIPAAGLRKEREQTDYYKIRDIFDDYINQNIETRVNDAQSFSDYLKTAYSDQVLSQFKNTFKSLDIDTIGKQILEASSINGIVLQQTLDDNSAWNEILSEIPSQNRLRQQAAAEEIVATIGQQMSTQEGIETDLAVAMATANSDQNIENWLKIGQIASNLSESTTGEIIGSWLNVAGVATEKDYYKMLTHKTDLEGISSDEIRATVLGEIIRIAGAQGGEGIKNIVGDELWENTFKDTFENFRGLNEYLKEAKTLGIPTILNSFKGLKVDTLNSELGKLTEKSKQLREEGYSLLERGLIDDPRITEALDQAQMLDNYVESIQTQADYIKSTVSQSLGYALGGTSVFTQDKDALGIYDELSEKYSLNELTSIGSYLTNARSFYGVNTAETMYNLFNGANGSNVFKELSKVNWDTSLSGLASLSQLASRAGEGLNDFRELLDSAVKDVGGEGGIFNKLYNSSGFSKVLEKLETAYKVNGRITASDISKYAEKSEELYSYLQISDASDQLKMNSAGLAATLTAVNEGIITAEQVNSDVVRALSIANQREANEAEAFEYVDNQDLGRSGGDIMKFFQGWGKAVYSAQVNNLAMDDPLMAVMNYMPAQVQQAYYESMKNGAGKTYQDLIRNNPALEEFDSLTQLLMGKKGKGGGTIKDVISAYGEMMGNTENPGIIINEQLGSRWTREFAESLGLEWGKEYNIRDFTNYLGFDFGENNIGLYGERQGVEGKLGSTWLKTGMEEAFTALLGGNKEEAKALASIFLEDIHNSSSSYQVKQIDTQEAIEDLRTSNKSGQTFSDGGTGGQHFYNRATLEAIYSQSKGYLQDTEYGKTLDDFINHVLGDNGLLLDTSTSELFSEGLSQGTLTSLLDLQNQANDGQFQNMRDLLYSYGAIYSDESNTGGVLDVNRWTDFVLATGGNAKIASDLLGFMDSEYLNNNGNFTLGTSFSDKFGRTYGLTQNPEESYSDFMNRVQGLQAVMNSGAIDVAQYDENGNIIRDENGNAVYEQITDLTGFKAAELQSQGYHWTEVDFGNGLKSWALTKNPDKTSPVNPSEWGSTSAPSDTTGTPPSSGGGTSETGETTTSSTTSTPVSSPNITQPPPQGKFSNWSTDAEQAAALAEFGGYDAASAKAKEAGFNGDMRGIMDYYAYTHEGALSNWSLTPEQIAYADKKAYGNQYADADKRYSSRMDAQLQANARARADKLRAQQAIEAKERDKAFRKEQKEAAKKTKAEEDKRKADQAEEVRLRTLREERLRRKEEAIQAKIEEDKRKADQAEEVKKQTEINNLVENGYTIEEATNIANGVWTEAEVETARIQAQKETDDIVAAREAQEAEIQNTVDYIDSLMDEGYSQNIAEAIVFGEMTKEEADQLIAQGKLMMDARARDKGFEEGGQQLSPEEQEKRQNELAAKRAYIADEMGVSNMLGATEYTEEEIRGVREGTITKEQVDTAKEAKKQAEDAKKQAEENARASAALTEAAKLRAEEETKAAESAAAASEADQALYNAQMENAAQFWIEQNGLDQERASFTGSNVQFQNFVESRNLARDLEEQAFAAQEAAADLEDMGEDASEQYNKASDLATQADKAGFTADQLNFQYNMSKEDRADFIADARSKFQNGEQLTAFERQALTALGELVETSDGQYQLAKDAQEAEDNRTKNKSNVTTNEEGQLVDEKTGEPIELPYDQPTSSGSSGPGYTPSGDGGTPGGGGNNGSGGNGSNGTTTEPKVDVTKGFTEVGQGYQTGKGNYTLFRDESDGTEYRIYDDDGHAEFANPNDAKQNDIGNAIADLKGGNNASGQNNARILQFAQGHMAVTGELGPELTIREDGSVDMLGQHGREYTWVNPNDIIYTAAQTASILDNNNIEWLEGFAKGFNNKIHGYAPGYTGEAIAGETLTGSTDNPGGVNGFSGVGEAVRRGAYSGTYGGAMAAAEEEVKDPRYDPNTLKERDIVTRYFTILQQIDDITREVEHFGKVAERAWGEERVQAIQRQTDAYKEQYAAYQKYMAEIETYLRSDQDALTLMVEEFARDFKEKTSIDIFGGEASNNGVKGVSRAYMAASGQNNNIKPHANGYMEISSWGNKVINTSSIGGLSTDGTGDPNLRTPINWVSAEYDANGVLTNYREIVTRLMEVYNENAEAFAQDKEAQYKFQEMLKDIQFYTDSLNLYEQQKEVFSDLRNAILDNQIRKIVYEISYENELDNNALKEINYNFEKIRDNAYRSAEAIDYYATKMDYLDKSNERYKEGIKDILATYSGNVTNGIQRQIMMRLYRKAPMEGYTTVDETGLSSVAADAGISWAGVTSFKEAYTIEGGDITSTEETTKLAVDHVDENGLIHLNDGSIVDPIKKKRYKAKSDTTGQAINSVGLAGDWTTSYIEKNSISSTSSSEEEKEELPYFPTSVEIEDYFKNFKAVKIGEETYYVPNDTNVDIREDMVQPVDITRAIVDNKGRLSQDEKDLITTQVKSWYDELANMAPELAKDIKPIYENGFMVNFREVMNAINEANAHMSDYMYDLLLNDTEEFFKIWSKVTVENADFQDLTTETATQLESMIDTIYANLQQKEKYIETIIATLGNDIKTFNKDLNAQVDEFEYFNEVMNDYQSIIDLTNRRSTNIGSGLISSLRGALLDNAINKVSGTKTVRDTMAQMKAQAQETYDVVHKAFEDYRNELLQTMSAEEAAQDAHYQYLQDRLDQVQDEMDIANAKFEDSNKQFLKAWEDALSKIQSDYTDAVQEATRTFEESFSPFFNTLDLLQAQFEREKALEDYYVDDYQRIHDLAALDRSIEQSILDTDNLKSKGRLRDLQKEINDLQDEGNDLSAYDLDILQKKYDLELARQALEEAKDAKSLVRLARDNNGNWSYVYTSSEEDVSQAEQNYENAIRSMEETNENYIDNLEAQILQVNQSAEQTIAALDPSDFANLDEYQAAIENIRRGAEETMRYLAEQLKHAFGNNDYLDPFIRDRYNGQNLHNLTNDWGDMTLAVVSGVNSLDAMVRLSQENLGNLGMAAADAFTEYSDKQAEVYATAGADITDANGYFTAGINTVMAMSDENVAKTTALADRVGDAFEKTAAKVRDFNKDIFDLAAQYEKLNSVMIKFLEISGDYVPEEKLDFSTTIDTYKELDEIKQVLGKYGKLIVTDYDEQGNRRIYNLEENTEATAKQFDAWYDAMAKSEAIDVGDDLDTQEEYDKINAYLEKHGQVYVSIDGELKKLSKDNEEDMAWLQDKLTAIQEAAKQTEQSIAYFGDYVSDGPGKDTAFYGTVEHEEGSPTITVHFPGGGGYVTENGVWDHALDTGGYTGRWQYADTGMYTGEWDGGSERKNGRLAWLHQKELVLNAHDTENFLDAMNIVRQLDNLASWMANGLGDLFMPKVESNDETLEQNVHIEASFPNAVDHNEIEQAFGNLVNLASQYANRKAFA